MDRNTRGWHRRRNGNERGTSIVEAAIVIPLLMTVLFGIIEFGFAYNDYLALRSAAREGARIAAVNNGCLGSAASVAPCGNADSERNDLLADTIKKSDQLSAKKDIAISVWLPDGSAAANRAVGKDVAVSLSTQMKSRTGLFAPFIDPITLKATARMRLEQKPTYSAGDASCSDLAGTKNGAGPAPAC